MHLHDMRKMISSGALHRREHAECVSPVVLPYYYNMRD